MELLRLPYETAFFGRQGVGKPPASGRNARTNPRVSTRSLDGRFLDLTIGLLRELSADVISAFRVTSDNSHSSCFFPANQES